MDIKGGAVRPLPLYEDMKKLFAVFAFLAFLVLVFSVLSVVLVFLVFLVFFVLSMRYTSIFCTLCIRYNHSFTAAAENM